MTAMNAADVRTALASRWPDAEYQRINEAPQDSSRQGRKIDVLVMSLWNSRGHEVDAVEIKVSLSDWKRELDHPEKADWWFQHCDRYWIACPVAIAPRIREQLPSTWGLLACSPEGSKAVVAAPNHTRRAFTWAETIGLIRAAADAGPNMLARAEERGRVAGYKAGKFDGERASSEVVAKAHLDELRASVTAFEQASGVKITDRFRDSERIGALLKMVMDWTHSPEQIVKRLQGAAKALSAEASVVTALADVIGDGT